MTRKSPDIAIWHVAVPVDDLERSVGFYCGHLGFDLVGRDDDETMQQAFVSLGDGGFSLELFVPLGEQAGAPRLRPDHLAFECKDIDAYRMSIVASGLVAPAVETFPGGMKHFQLRDPDNVRLDFFEGRAGYDAYLASRAA